MYCRSILSVILTLAIAFTMLPAGAAQDIPDPFTNYNGFRVIGRDLVAPDGEIVVPVGVNKMVIWTDRDGLPAFPEIAKTGANAVRIVWLTEGSAQELDIAITNAITHELIPLIDCHDTTGVWALFPSCVDFWVRPDILAVIDKHEDYLLVNIANEPDRGDITDSDYRAGYEWAIKRLRAAGIRVPLVVDGQDWSSNFDLLRKNAPYIMQIDPLQNVMFDMHIYKSSQDYGYQIAQIVANDLIKTAEAGIPFIVGEFAEAAPQCKMTVPYEAIITTAHEYSIGWFAWSWGPGNLDCGDMDMTEDGTFETLHGWGLGAALEHEFSIRNVAVRPQHILNIEPPQAGLTLPPPPAPAADLMIEALAWDPAEPVKGDDVRLTVTITNRGSEPAAGPFRVRFEAKNTLVAWADVDRTIAPGEAITVTATGGPDGDALWNEILPGNTVLFVWADDQNTVIETDDFNNMLAVNVRVGVTR